MRYDGWNILHGIRFINFLFKLENKKKSNKKRDSL